MNNLPNTREGYRDILRKYANVTYQECLDNLFNTHAITQDEYEKAQIIIHAPQKKGTPLALRNMTIESVQNLQPCEVELGRFSFRDVMAREKAHWGYKTNLATLITTASTELEKKRDYIIATVHKNKGYENWGWTQIKCGYVNRILRNSPSFYREDDPYYYFKQRMKTHPNEHFSQSRYLDLKKHADFLLKIDGEKYDIYIWTYFGSDAGCLNTALKLLSSLRGTIPKGLHLIVPATDDTTEIDPISKLKLYKDDVWDYLLDFLIKTEPLSQEYYAKKFFGRIPKNMTLDQIRDYETAFKKSPSSYIGHQNAQELLSLFKQPRVFIV